MTPDKDETAPNSKDPVIDGTSASRSADDAPGMRSLRSHVENALQRYQDMLAHGRARHGRSTGFSALDTISNGLLPSMIYVVASRPSMGKTSLLLNIVADVCLKQNTPSIFFSGDLRVHQIIDRLIFNRAMAPLCAFSDSEHTPNKADLQRIQKCAQELAVSGLVLDDNRDMTIESIASRAREERAKTGIGLIVIDHLHLIRSESTQPGTSRKREMSGVMREIKNLARELELPVLVSAQLKRRADGRLPRCGDIRESVAIENDADFVGLLHKEGPTSDEDCVKLLIAKNNNGPRGTVRLFFSEELQRFEHDPVVYHEENEIERAWRSHQMEKDFPEETE